MPCPTESCRPGHGGSPSGVADGPGGAPGTGPSRTAPLPESRSSDGRGVTVRDAVHGVLRPRRGRGRAITGQLTGDALTTGRRPGRSWPTRPCAAEAGRRRRPRRRAERTDGRISIGRLAHRRRVLGDGHGGPLPSTPAHSRAPRSATLTAVRRCTGPAAALLPGGRAPDDHSGLLQALRDPRGRRRIGVAARERADDRRRSPSIPVAGRDCMELNLSGAHAPYFTRNVLVLEDSEGRTGLGEVPGGEKITADPARRRAARRRRQRVGDYNARPARDRAALRRPRRRRPRRRRPSTCAPPSTRSPPSSRPCSTCSASTSDVPVAALLGDGQQRDAVRMLGYLFYVGDRHRTDLDYVARRRTRPSTGTGSATRRRSPRRRSSGRPRPPSDRYGFRDFKLKGGVLAGDGGGRGRHRAQGPLPRRPDHPRPERRLVAARGGRAVPRPARRARLRRGPLRGRGRLLRPGDPRRVPPRPPACPPRPT